MPARTAALPGTERSILRIGLGGMPLSLAGRPDAAEASRIVQHAAERGMTLIDTADSYGLDDSDTGHNERLIASTLRAMGLDLAGALEGDGPVVATKGGMTRPRGRWKRNGTPEHLRTACHASLRALGVERIPLYQLHWPDPAVPYAESVGALVRLRDEGKIGLIGVSNVSVAQLDEAMALTPVASVQNRLSLWDVGWRDPPIVRQCERHGILFLAYATLGGAGRAAGLSEVAALRSMGERLGASPQELALAWLLRLGPSVVPIPGATRTESVDSSLRALEVGLGAGDAAALERIGRRLDGQPGLAGRVLRKLRGILRR